MTSKDKNNTFLKAWSIISGILLFISIGDLQSQFEGWKALKEYLYNNSFLYDLLRLFDEVFQVYDAVLSYIFWFLPSEISRFLGLLIFILSPFLPILIYKDVNISDIDSRKPYMRFLIYHISISIGLYIHTYLIGVSDNEFKVYMHQILGINLFILFFILFKFIDVLLNVTRNSFFLAKYIDYAIFLLALILGIWSSNLLIDFVNSIPSVVLYLVLPSLLLYSILLLIIKNLATSNY